MSGADVEERVVVLVDLRTADLALLLSRPFSRTQTLLATAHGGAAVDLRRAVVIDDVSMLEEHHRVYEHILGTDVDVSVLCVAVGIADAADAAAAIRRPALLGPPRAATLWVGDVDGVGWRMESSQAQAVHGQGDADIEEIRTVPEALMRALLLPQVFDRVIEVVGALPGAVASPGLRVLLSDLDPEVLRAAQDSAIRRLTDEEAQWSGQKAAAQRRLLPAADNAGPDIDPISRSGRFQQHYTDLLNAAEEGELVIGRLLAPTAPVRRPDGRATQTLGRLATAAEALATDAELVIDLVDPAGRGTDVARYTDLGVVPAAVVPQLSATALAAVREATLEDFDSRRPLPEIAARLRAATEGAAYRGAAAYRERLRAVLPEALTARLAGGGSPADYWPRPGLYFATAAVSAVAAFWPTPDGVGALLSAIAVGAAAFCVRGRLAAQAADARPHWGSAAWFTLVGAVGAGAGGLISRQLMTPAATVLSIVMGVLLAGVAGVVLSILWWRSAVRAWAKHLGVSSLRSRAREVRGLVEQAAREGRRARQRRSDLYDYTRILAAVVDDLTEGLRSADLSEPGAGEVTEAGWSRKPFADQDPESRLAANPADVEALVAADLCDIATTAFSAFATVPRPGEARIADSDTVRARLAALIDDYRRHLHVAGVHHTPPVCRHPAERQERVDAAWEATARLSDLVWSGPRDARIVQLCDAAQLMMLDIDSAELVRFVPDAARASLGPAPRSAGGGTAMVWTGASQVFGMMRLVALRPGSVEETWPTDVPASGERSTRPPLGAPGSGEPVEHLDTP